MPAPKLLMVRQARRDRAGKGFAIVLPMLQVSPLEVLGDEAVEAPAEVAGV